MPKPKHDSKPSDPKSHPSLEEVIDPMTQIKAELEKLGKMYAALKAGKPGSLTIEVDGEGCRIDSADGTERIIGVVIGGLCGILERRIADHRKVVLA